MKKCILMLCALGVGGGTGAATHAARIPPMPPASSFSARVDNVWFPLLPGSRYVYTGVKDAKPARDVVGRQPPDEDDRGRPLRRG